MKTLRGETANRRCKQSEHSPGWPGSRARSRASSSGVRAGSVDSGTHFRLALADLTALERLDRGRGSEQEERVANFQPRASFGYHPLLGAVADTAEDLDDARADGLRQARLGEGARANADGTSTRRSAKSGGSST